jgi:uncharacterized membrane protein YkvA (DUF1232 family)
MQIDALKPEDASVRPNSAKWNERFQFIMRQARTMLLAVKHPSVPWPAKLIAACSVGYIFSPIQLIPTFIPVIGQLDDLAVLLVGMKLLRRLTPAAILAECESHAQSKTFYLAPPHPPQAEYHEREAA